MLIMCRQPISVIYFCFSLLMWSHRVLRHTVFICASRSLSVQASACRSCVPPHHSLGDKGGGGTLIFIDVENINMVRYTACNISPIHNVWTFLLLLWNLSTYQCSSLVLILLTPRVKLACVSSTLFRCPAAVNTGASTSASTLPRIKVGMAELCWCSQTSRNAKTQDTSK